MLEVATKVNLANMKLTDNIFNLQVKFILDNIKQEDIDKLKDSVLEFHKIVKLIIENRF